MTTPTRKPLTWLVAGAVLVLSAPGLPAVAAGDDIPITEPALLESLGLGPDATNIYATPQAYEQLMISSAERASVQEMQPSEQAAAQEGEAAVDPFGPGAVGFSSISGVELIPAGTDLASRYNDGLGRYCVEGSPWDGLLAQFTDIPHGARLENVRVWFWDNSADNLNVHVRRVCHPDASAGSPETTILGSIESEFMPGHGTAVIGSLAEDVDLHNCTYEVLANLGVTSGCPGNSSLAISKVRAQWRRQISPAPASPTFLDVPASHPFFQSIEALAASGITGGCGGGNYCPGGVVTRGEMAAFLTRALGL